MKKKTVLAVLMTAIVVVVCASMFVGCTPIGENMFSTDSEGVFKYETLSQLKSDWVLDVDDSADDVSKVFVMNYDKEDGDYDISIDTTDIGWATIGQKVKLTAGCYYRINYTISVTSISAYTTGKAYDGVFVTIAEDDDFNYTEEDLMHDTAVSKTQYSVTFKAKDTGDATVMLSVGTDEYPVDAVVTLYSMTLSRITKAEAIDNYAGVFQSDYYGLADDLNSLYIVFGGLAIALLCYFAYFAYQRHLNKVEKGGYEGGKLLKLSDSKILGMGIVVAVGALVALLTDVLSTVISSGYAHTTLGYNIEGLSAQALFIAKYGPQNLYKSLSAFCTDNSYTLMQVSAMPLQGYFLGFVGLFGRIFEGIGAEYIATMFFLRFFLSVANIGTALVIYNLVKKASGNVGATLIASLYTLLPTVFVTSSLWGYTEVITALLLVLTVSLMLKNNYVATAIVYFVACMFSTTALFIAPIVLIYTIMQCIRDVKNVIPASIILVLGFVAFYALCVPFDINSINDGKAFVCFDRVWAELYTSILYTRNAFNFQGVLDNNFTAISTASLVVSIVFVIFLLALVVIAYFKTKNRMHLLLLATAFINMMFVFGNNMQPTSIFVALALMLVYAIVNKEKRVYFAFSVFAVLAFVNISYVELFVGYSATAIGQMGVNAMTYVFGILYLLASLYYIYVVYDIVAAKKIMRIKPMALTYSEYLVNLGRRIKKGYYKLLIKLQRKA